MKIQAVDDRQRAPEHDAVVADVRALSPLIAERAEAMERAAVLDAEVVDGLRDAGVFRLMAPKRVGGLNADPATVIDVVSLLSYADGSTGWVSLATMTATGLIGAYAGPAAREAIFESAGGYVCAGTFQPRGTAVPEGDGCRIRGRFAFGSGSVHADWLMGGYIVQGADGPVPRADGSPKMLTGVARRDTVELLGNWDVMGLKGTASYDYEVSEQLVGPDFLFDLEETQPDPDSVIARVGARTMGALGHAAFPIGIARRILDEVAALAQAKKQITGGLLVDRRTFQLEFVKAFAATRAAEQYVRDTFTRLYELPENAPEREQLRAECRLAASHAVHTAGDVTHALYVLAGTDALRGGSTIQRCMRDMHAGTQHALTAEPTFIEAASVLLGVPKALIKP